MELSTRKENRKRVLPKDAIAPKVIPASFLPYVIVAVIVLMTSHSHCCPCRFCHHHCFHPYCYPVVVVVVVVVVVLVVVVVVVFVVVAVVFVVVIIVIMLCCNDVVVLLLSSSYAIVVIVVI